MFNFIRKAAVALAVTTLVTFSSTARLTYAGTDSPDQQQVEVLKKTVEILMHRVDKLEQKLDQIEGRQQRSTTEGATQEKAAQPASSAQKANTVTKNTAVEEEPSKLTPPESWARLKEGMTQAQVTELLGKPNTAFRLSGQTVWYYYYRNVGAGSVFFYDDGHVASRQKPPFSGWHW